MVCIAVMQTSCGQQERDEVSFETGASKNGQNKKKSLIVELER